MQTRPTEYFEKGNKGSGCALSTRSGEMRGAGGKTFEGFRGEEEAEISRQRSAGRDQQAEISKQRSEALGRDQQEEIGRKRAEISAEL